MRFIWVGSLLACNVIESAGAAELATDGGKADGLEEIVVTAEKYNSTIQNTPISISAMTGAQLAAEGITTVEQIAHEIPGLSMRSAGPGQTEYEARGLASNGGAAPTVGLYLDEVPLSPPALAQIGKVVIDPDLYDVDRVEVLRGPQGTLYGSGSMGGTVKIIANQPKLDTWEGSAQGTLSDTEGGSGNGGGNVMLNIPLGETLALRVVGSDSYRSGWIDRVVVNPFPQDSAGARGNVLAAPVASVATDVNTERVYGGRASVLFEPNTDLSIVATAMSQRMVMGGYDEFDSPPGAARPAHYEASDIPEPIADTVHIYSLTAIADAGFADLTSATSYWDRHEQQTQDASESISSATGVYPYVAIPYSEVDLTKQFSQELRLTSKPGRLRWVAGAFYSDLNSTWIEQSANAVYAGPGNSTGIIFDSDNPYKIAQSAVFADGSLEFADGWKFATGLRWYRYQSQQLENEWGAFATSATPLATPLRTAASDTGFNPRFNLSYSPNADLTAYVSATKGFRPGGANEKVPFSLCGPSPLSFGPDSVWDYEIGEKAKLFDNWLTINSDFYYIKWSGVQQSLLLACGYEYDGNAGNGRSLGPELEVIAKLSEHWRVAANGAYTDARITHPSAAYAAFLTGAAKTSNGQPYCATASACTAPILNVPRDTAALSVVYTTAILRDYQLTARVSDVYVGTTYDESYYFALQLPSYSIANARVSVEKDRWEANLFVDNLANKIAEISANNTSFQVNVPALIRYSTNQPRTVGMQLNYRF